MVFITYMERTYSDPLQLNAEWRKLADAFNIEVVEDPALAAQRDEQVDAKLRAMLGIG